MEIAVAWILLCIFLFLVSLLCASFGVHGILKAVFSALALVSFDILIDQLRSKGSMEMEQSRIFFGIPWRNFFGWILIGFVISLIFVNLTPNISNDSLMTVPVYPGRSSQLFSEEYCFRGTKFLAFGHSSAFNLFLFGLRLL